MSICVTFFFFFRCDGDHRDLHSFPTRRSSDLAPGRDRIFRTAPRGERLGSLAGRSEEHTSELQSRQYLVCRLLLEKKNKHEQVVGVGGFVRAVGSGELGAVALPSALAAYDPTL